MGFIDAIHLKVRHGQVSNRPFYVVIGVTVDGHRDILGIWAGTGGEGAKYWLQVLTEIKNRGVGDVCIVVCDGLAWLPAAINTVWPQTLVQACILHLIRNTVRYASRKYWEQMAKDLRPVDTEAAALERFEEFVAAWGGLYPAIVTLWRSAWSESWEFLDYDVDPAGHLLDHCDRVDQRPLPARGPRPGALPGRTSRAQVPQPRHEIAGPDREGAGPLGDALRSPP